MSGERDDKRHELLRLKSALLDRVAGLPAYPMLLDRLRAMLDERRALGVIHVAAANLAMVESLYGWQTFDRVLARMALALKQELGGLEQEHCLAVDRVAGGEFLLFVAEAHGGAGPGTELLDAIGARLRGALEAAFDDEAFRGMSPRLEFRVGHSRLSINPFYRFERRIHAAVEEARLRDARRSSRRERSDAQELRRIIDEAAVSTLFQAVVELASGSVLGYEALARGPKDSLFEMPHAMFRVSGRVGADLDLDRICRRAALAASAGADTPGMLFVNLSPASLDDPQWGDDAGNLRQDLVLEVSERGGDEDGPRFVDALQRLKGLGYKLALDDVGTGYSSMSTLERVQPDFLKVDLTLVRDVQDSLIKQEVITSLLQIAGKIGASVVAEGVEQEAEAAWLREAGATYGQGYLFASPLPAAQIEDSR